MREFPSPWVLLDVNMIALKPPCQRTSAYVGLAQLEYNYFMRDAIGLYVTPQALIEITEGSSVHTLGSTAMKRAMKCDLYHTRPIGTALTLSDQEANSNWCRMSDILFPNTSLQALTIQQRNDVTHLFFHYIAGGTSPLTSYVTADEKHILSKRAELAHEFSIRVESVNASWGRLQNSYDLYTADDLDLETMWSIASKQWDPNSQKGRQWLQIHGTTCR